MYNPTIANPDDYLSDVDALREEVRGELTGYDLLDEANAADGCKALGSMYLLAVTLNDEAEIGRLFVKHAKAAADRIIDKRVKS